MRWLTKLRYRVRSLFRSDRLDADLNEELEYHLARQTELNREAGMSADEARQAALRDFGGLLQRTEECREARGLRLVENTAQDVRYAVRALRRTPGFTAVAIGSLALGLGASATIFSFVNAVLLRPLPYFDSQRLVVLRERPLASATPLNVHPLNFVEWHSRARAFEALTLVQAIPTNVMGSDGAEQVVNVQTTSELFRVFAVAPALGRTFTEGETRPGSPALVVLGHGFWQRRFGGDPRVLGRGLAVSDGALTIVGVAPPGLRVGLTEADIYTPLRIDPANPSATGSRAFDCYGRLKPGVTPDAAQSEMAAIGGALARLHRLDEGYTVSVSGLQDHLVAGSRRALSLLAGVSAVVLLIACVNLAGLLLARGLARQKELALRASLGASRGRLVRQLVVESLTLALAGAVAALAAAFWATRTLVTLAPGLTIGPAAPVRLDATGVLFTCGLACCAALVFGLVPAWQASHVEPQASLGAQSRGGTADRRQHRMRGLLVAAQVALAVVLLVGAGLLLRTFAAMARVDLGFQAAGTITMRLFLGVRPDVERVALLERILERVEAVPGVEAAGTIQFLPLGGMTCGTGFWLEGDVPDDPARARPTNCSLVSRGYFAAMQIPMLEGRGFDATDRADTPRVVVVNRSFARRHFAGGHAVGRRVLMAGRSQAWARIVGVSGDTRHESLTADPAPTVYQLHAQGPGYITSLVARTTADPGATAASIRRAIHDVDPTQAVSAVKTMERYVDDSLAQPRLHAALVASFAVLAVTLAIVGVYGLISYIVTLRTHEIGVRVALGAARAHILGIVLRGAATLVFGGLAVGLGAAVALRGLLSAFVFGVAPGDALTYIGATTAFLVAAGLAAGVPAVRAARMDPAAALRHE